MTKAYLTTLYIQIPVEALVFAKDTSEAKEKALSQINEKDLADDLNVGLLPNNMRMINHYHVIAGEVEQQESIDND